MQYTDIVGTLGVGLILAAYCCNIFGLTAKDSRIFFAMNIAGAALACYASLLIHYWPFVILEGTWTLVSVIGFVKTFKQRL